MVRSVFRFRRLAVASLIGLMGVLPHGAQSQPSPESDPQQIRRLLVEQVTGRVRWRETIAGLRDRGITSVVEVGAVPVVVMAIADREDADADAFRKKYTVDCLLTLSESRGS